MNHQAFPARLCLIVLLLALPLTVAVAEEPWSEQVVRGTVSWVYDGDTLEIDPFGKVRLIGIDCPEREASPERDRKFIRQGADPELLRRVYDEALHYNIRIVKGQIVSLSFDESRYDRHGRLLAYVWLPDGTLLNRRLLERGLAVVYRRFDFSEKQDFLAAEDTARLAGKGLWAGQNN